MVRRHGDTACPSCGAAELAPIVYGLPGSELEEKAMRGDVVLGGCVVTPEQPDTACLVCGHSWRAGTATRER